MPTPRKPASAPAPAKNKTKPAPVKPAAAKAPPARPTPATKSAAKTSAKSAPATKAAAKTSAKSAPAAKAAAKTSAKSAPATKSAAKTSAKSAPATKPAAKTSAKSAPATKSAAKTSAKSAPAKKPASKTAVKPAPAKKPAAKTAAKPAPAKKPAAKTAAKPAPARKPAAPAPARAAAAKPAARKTAAPAPARKTGAAPATAADPGEAAHAALAARLSAVPAERVGQPRTDVRAAAQFVLSDTVPRLRDRALRAGFAALPAAHFDHGALDALEPAAQAALWTQARLAETEAGESGLRLPLELLADANELRLDMLDVCTYHFRGTPRLVQQLDDIRKGQGYLDLAEDLRRLAGLYRAERKTLALDGRYYQAGDADKALALSDRITRELRMPRTQAVREASWRSWALLLALYDEVARGGRFLLRAEGEAAFPSLFAVSRARPTRQKPQTPAPAPAPSGT